MKAVFDQALQRGIRPDDRVPRNTMFFQNVRNLSAGEFGLRPFRNIVQPITNAALTSATITKSYPFPQLHRGKKYAILLDEDAIFTATPTPSGDWPIAATPVVDFSTYNWDADSGSTATITGSKDWHTVDLWDFFMAFNGTETIFKPGFSDKFFYQDDVTITTGTTYQDGRLFLGGFDDTDIHALVDWPTILAAFHGDYPVEVTKPLREAMGQNWIWWSDVGMSNVMQFFSADYMKYMSLSSTVTTEFTAADPFWLRIAQKRDSFGMPMPTPGRVLKMAQLGACVVVYSEDGTHSVVPVDTSTSNTFGHREVAGFGHQIGVKQGTLVRAAAGGNEQIQAMISDANDLYILTPDGIGCKAEKLGYRHLFSAGGEWMVGYDPSEQEFHFSASDRCYRLSRTGGMSRAPHIPTSVFFGRANNASSAMGILINDADTTGVTLVTDWFDQGDGTRVPELWRFIMSCGDTNASAWTVVVEARRSERKDRTDSSASITPESRGVAEVQMSGAAFRATFTHPDRTTARLDRLEAEFGDGSRRSIETWQT